MNEEEKSFDSDGIGSLEGDEDGSSSSDEKTSSEIIRDLENEIKVLKSKNVRLEKSVEVSKQKESIFEQKEKLIAQELKKMKGVVSQVNRERSELKQEKTLLDERFREFQERGKMQWEMDLYYLFERISYIFIQVLASLGDEVKSTGPLENCFRSLNELLFQFCEPGFKKLAIKINFIHRCYRGMINQLTLNNREIEKELEVERTNHKASIEEKEKTINELEIQKNLLAKQLSVIEVVNKQQQVCIDGFERRYHAKLKEQRTLDLNEISRLRAKLDQKLYQYDKDMSELAAVWPFQSHIPPSFLHKYIFLRKPRSSEQSVQSELDFQIGEECLCYSEESYLPVIILDIKYQNVYPEGASPRLEENTKEVDAAELLLSEHQSGFNIQSFYLVQWGSTALQCLESFWVTSDFLLKFNGDTSVDSSTQTTIKLFHALPIEFGRPRRDSSPAILDPSMQLKDRESMEQALQHKFLCYVQKIHGEVLKQAPTLFRLIDVHRRKQITIWEVKHFLESTFNKENVSIGKPRISVRFALDSSKYLEEAWKAEEPDLTLPIVVNQFTTVCLKVVKDLYAHDLWHPVLEFKATEPEPEFIHSEFDDKVSLAANEFLCKSKYPKRLANLEQRITLLIYCIRVKVFGYLPKKAKELINIIGLLVEDLLGCANLCVNDGTLLDLLCQLLDLEALYSSDIQTQLQLLLKTCYLQIIERALLYLEDKLHNSEKIIVLRLSYVLSTLQANSSLLYRNIEGQRSLILLQQHLTQIFHKVNEKIKFQELVLHKIKNSLATNRTLFIQEFQLRQLVMNNLLLLKQKAGATHSNGDISNYRNVAKKFSAFSSRLKDLLEELEGKLIRSRDLAQVLQAEFAQAESKACAEIHILLELLTKTNCILSEPYPIDYAASFIEAVSIAFDNGDRHIFEEKQTPEPFNFDKYLDIFAKPLLINSQLNETSSDSVLRVSLLTQQLKAQTCSLRRTIALHKRSFEEMVAFYSARQEENEFLSSERIKCLKEKLLLMKEDFDGSSLATAISIQYMKREFQNLRHYNKYFENVCQHKVNAAMTRVELITAEQQKILNLVRETKEKHSKIQRENLAISTSCKILFQEKIYLLSRVKELEKKIKTNAEESKESLRKLSAQIKNRDMTLVYVSSNLPVLISLFLDSILVTAGGSRYWNTLFHEYKVFHFCNLLIGLKDNLPYQEYIRNKSLKVLTRSMCNGHSDFRTISRKIQSSWISYIKPQAGFSYKIRLVVGGYYVLLTYIV
eukprot:snap_masked-scaffold_8-processed-gene-14.25-mRNA-1 protein AED:1.00 eAED:1.00 QI:0/0/0/0/1/1/5/0/1251